MSKLKIHPRKLRKPKRLWRRAKAFHIFEREGITYYIQSDCVLLNPEDVEYGQGILLAKPTLNNEPVGVYFTKKVRATTREEKAAEVAYFYAVGKPRKGLYVVPITIFPGCYDHSPENVKALLDAGDIFAYE